jgi:hypothetical protein
MWLGDPHPHREGDGADGSGLVFADGRNGYHIMADRLDDLRSDVINTLVRMQAP